MANGVQLASENFTRANENPLSDGGKWTTATGRAALQLLSNACEVSAQTSVCISLWTGNAWPDSQYCEVTTKNWASGSGNFLTLGLRWDATAQNGYECLVNGTNSFSIYRRDADSPTLLVTGTASIAGGGGDIIRFTACGGSLTVMMNQAIILKTYDATYASGSVGIRMVETSATIGNMTLSSWSGGNAAGNSSGPWTKQGIAIIPATADLGGSNIPGTNNQTMLYDTNPQLISPNLDGKVFKMWFVAGDGTGTFYAESNTGLPGNWTRRGTALATLSGCQIPRVYKNPGDGVYHMYINDSASWVAITHFSSSDGIVWTSVGTNVLPLGTAGAWDDTNVYYLQIMDLIAGTYYAIYSGFHAGGSAATGMATTTDLNTFTKYVSNPVIAGGTGGGGGAPDQMYKISGTYYGWQAFGNAGQTSATQGAASIVRMQTTDFITWTGRTFSIQRDTPWEGLNLPNGEMSVPSVLEVNGSCYMYYSSSPTESSVIAYQIACATAPYTVAQLVSHGQEYFQTYNQVAVDNCTRADENPLSNGGAWVTVSGLHANQLLSDLITPASTSFFGVMVYSGGPAIFNNQYVDVTLHALSSASSCFPEIRGSASNNNKYTVLITGSALGSSISLGITKAFSGTNTPLGPTVNLTLQVGDIVRLAVTGSLLSFYQNGSLISEVTDYSAAISTGFPGLALNAVSSLSNAQVSNWAEGNTLSPAGPQGGMFSIGF